jgi:hypothetical protein
MITVMETAFQGFRFPEETMKETLRETSIAVFLMFSLISASTKDGFGVIPDQYNRVLQLIKAKGVFNSYTHSCEMQSDGTGYRCEDHLDKIVVVYHADNEKAQINSVTVGALPENTDRAAALAATAATTSVFNGT